MQIQSALVWWFPWLPLYVECRNSWVVIPWLWRMQMSWLN